MDTVKIRNNVQWLQMLFDYAPDAYYLLDLKGNFIDGNKEAEKLTGYNKEELINKNFRKLKILTQLDIVKAVKLLAENLKGQPTGPDEFNLIRKDGSEITIEVRTFPIQFDKSSLVLGIARDITERREMEMALIKTNHTLKKMQSKLIQAEKNAALGRFAGGISHQLKNPLGIILSGVELLGRKLHPEDPEVIEILERLKNTVFRADNIIKGLNMYSKPMELFLEKTKTPEIINEILIMMDEILSKRKIEISINDEDGEVFLKVDKIKLQHAIFQLIENAVEAMPEGGLLEIRTSVNPNPREFGIDAFKAYVIDIIDHGDGMPSGILKQAFEPFFTTKQDNKSIGLGLSMAKAFIDCHNGEIVIDSKQGEGSIAKIIIPLTP